jgi:hypothetical protein
VSVKTCSEFVAVVVFETSATPLNFSLGNFMGVKTKRAIGIYLTGVRLKELLHKRAMATKAQ